MDNIECGRCTEAFQGDPWAISLCDECFRLLTEEQGYSERELWRKYPPKGESDADQ